jgi:hypothetical protein
MKQNDFSTKLIVLVLQTYLQCSSSICFAYKIKHAYLLHFQPFFPSAVLALPGTVDELVPRNSSDNRQKIVDTKKMYLLHNSLRAVVIEVVHDFI